MRAEKVVWWLAVACAVFLLPTAANPKTVRVFADGTREIQGWGWQNVASWAGIVVLVALAAGRIARPAVPVAALCASIAVTAFGGAAAEAGRTWIDLTKEAANPGLYGYADIEYTLRPATGMEETVLVGATGAACCLVLLGILLRSGRDEL